MSLNKNGLAFVTACESIFGDEAVVNRDDIAKVCAETDAPYPYWLVTKSQYRYDRGQYKLPPSGEKIVKKSEKIVKNLQEDCKEPETEMETPDINERFTGMVYSDHMDNRPYRETVLRVLRND